MDTKVKSLNNIIEFLHDSESCYKDHIDHVENATLKDHFKMLHQSRRKMILELEDCVRALNDEPSEHGTLLGQAHRVYENIKTLLTQGNLLSITKEIRRGESVLIQYYQEALKEDLPEEIKTKLRRQLEQIENEVKAVDEITAKA